MVAENRPEPDSALTNLMTRWVRRLRGNIHDSSWDVGSGSGCQACFKPFDRSPNASSRQVIPSRMEVELLHKTWPHALFKPQDPTPAKHCSCLTAFGPQWWTA